ncbi:hypothetical protein GCM10027570_24990 [Streptomonospora sediminis]
MGWQSVVVGDVEGPAGRGRRWWCAPQARGPRLCAPSGRRGVNGGRHSRDPGFLTAVGREVVRAVTVLAVMPVRAASAWERSRGRGKASGRQVSWRRGRVRIDQR